MPGREGEAPPLLSVRSLECRRGGRRLFNGLGFELRAGQALALHGTDGSGKSSLLRLLAGLMPSPAQAVAWRGRPVAPGADALHDIAYLGHHNGLCGALTALENLRFAQRLRGPGDEARLLAALDSWQLGALAARPVQRLSQGQQRRLALARAGLHGPRLWLLDEPCAALDEAGQRLFDDRLARHLAQGGVAVVATHQPLRLPASQCRQLLLGQPAAC